MINGSSFLIEDTVVKKILCLKKICDIIIGDSMKTPYSLKESCPKQNVL